MRARVLEAACGALAAIEAARARIDDLNVYPVPDGDTGTNLALTVRAVVEALEASLADDRSSLAREISRAALMGARGNSGVILSQIVRGAADSLASRDGLAPALRSASDAAYRAVRKPVEGTMLTAIRELAEAAEAGGDLAAVIARGDDCVVRTRKMLPVLAEAGVVDAGAAGLVEILRGIAGVLVGEPLPEAPVVSRPAPTIESLHAELSPYRYCTAFVVEGTGLDADELDRELDPLGDSLLVVGDPTALKVHLHTDDPGRALSLAVARGTLANVEITDMYLQTIDRRQRLLHAVPDTPPSLCAVVAVASGSGNRALFENLGAVVVDGGRTMNPSTAELLAAVAATGAPEVIVLPNDRNVVLSAEHAAEVAEVPVSVLQTTTIQSGLAAALAFDATLTRAENAAAMTEAAGDIATGAVTTASRDVESNGVAIREGAWLGLADGVPVAGGESFDEVALAVVDALLAEPRGILTFLTGEEPQPLERVLEELAAAHPELELEVQQGGQAHYALLVSAE
jgi:fatty acid kinase